MNQESLLRIVRTWRINPKHEYRGFRCANCQRSLDKAWHHWLTSGGYVTPVHLCASCEKLAKEGKLKKSLPQSPLVSSRFYRNLPEKARRALAPLSLKAKPQKPRYHSFTCDKCRTRVLKAYHIWSFLKGRMRELHLCKRCGDAVLKG